MCKTRIMPGEFSILLILGVIATWSGVCPAADDPSLIGWWQLNEAGGATAADSTANHNDGTLHGKATFTAGLYNRGLYCDGAEAYMTLPNALPAVCTLAFWFRPDWNGSDSPDYRLFDASAGDKYFFISKGSVHDVMTAAYFGFFFEDAADTDFQTVRITAADNITAKTWYHVAATWRFPGGPAVLYFNGKEVSSATGGLGAFATLAANPRFGYATGSGGVTATNGAAAVFDDIKLFNRVLTADEIPSLMEGTATELASDPQPADKATDVLRDAVLSWKPGAFAGTHNVYLGTRFDDINDVKTADSPLCVSRGQDANAYDPPGPLDYGATYYWRVEEVNATADHTPFMGEVWSFATEPVGYKIAKANITATASGSATGSSPQSTVDESGLTGDLHNMASAAMWITVKNPTKPVWLQYDFDQTYKLYQLLVWNANSESEEELNYGLQDVVIEYSGDGATWTKLGDFVFNQATATEDYAYNTVVDFGGIVAKSVRLTAQSTYGGPKYCLSEVRFLYIPVRARAPQPAADSNGVDPRDLTVHWRPGREAAVQTVYLGTDPAALTPAGPVVANSAALGTLNVATKYYWRVDEANAAETPGSWTGTVWSFTTLDFLPVDDFEAYNDSEGAAVFNAWEDGYGKTDNGGQIGYDIPGPYMEKAIRHGGAQSTPFNYRNAGTPARNFSEATRTFDPAQDWTIAKADTLRIWVRGRTADLPAGTLPAATTAFDISSAGADVYQATDQFRFVYRQLTGDGSITAKIESQMPTNQYAKAGVMIRVGLEAGALETHMVTLPGANNTTNTPKQVEWNFRPTLGDATARTVSTTPTTLSTWVRLTRKGDVITGEYSADGVTWVSTGLTTSPQTIAMGNPVNIGLVVCSHVAATLGEAKFSNVKVTGNVTGEWQKADIGITAQPAGNTADTFYVTVADNAGKTRTVVPTLANPACTSADWQAVDIPFSQFTGVSLTSVKSLTFGVGDRAGTSPLHGAGLIYLDDIGIGRATTK